MKLTRTKRLWLILLLMITAYLLMYSVVSDRKTSHNHEKTATITKSQTTKTGDNGTVTKQTIANDDSEEEQEIERSYYNTIEDAVKGSDFALEEGEEVSYTNKKEIKEKVLFLESDTDALLFFIGNFIENKDDSDALVVYKFKVKKEGNQTKYSTPTNATQIPAESEKRIYKRGGSKYEIQTCLNLYNAYQSFNLYPETTQLQWGMSYNKSAPNLTINGDRPTKVIPIKMDGDDCYFWYYEDLKYDSSKKAEISFKKTK
ncbi:hypothetical protein HBP63_11805 [Listeria welshimeri]|uniref:hypothetical protein n=1 Tax=Listeria welshimeri TaxID=1643 RepID=UPI0016232678|nr:hypothetical protein [Listeria welshimeri]MBC1861619.1 hypothetical protein [Listeria welshimeri]MBC2299799.1 hypothetical protein [Listeria welshimeri]MBC2355103.1 hypothetical protein [Listeria welshimeri]MBC6158530.1 hypothetical protein [Listeria welshimeri]MBF2465396.1 hypothetical protein [Listeria welshimeri]